MLFDYILFVNLYVYSLVIKIMRVFDIFGPKVGLNYNGSRSYKTWFGGAMTILFYIVILFFGATAIQDFVLKRNTSLVTQR